MLEDTTIHNAITDKALASYFRSSGNFDPTHVIWTQA